MDKKTPPQQLTERLCKPVLMYNLAADKLSKTEYQRIEYAWNAMMYKIYAVSGDTMNVVYAYTNYVPIGMLLSYLAS